MFRVAPKTGITPRGKILFASRMTDPKGFDKISSNLGFMIPPLRDHGYEVLVSQANVGLMRSSAGFLFMEDLQAGERFREDLARSEKQVIETMQEEIDVHEPDFVAFSAYDINVLSIFNIATALAKSNPTVAFVFGGHFITINPQVVRDNFTDFPNIIMINGEAEFALPQALMAFQDSTKIESPGIFIQRMDALIGDTFDQRVSLTSEEHAGLEFYLDVQADQLRFMLTEFNEPGVDLFTSRGCFRGCSYCAASSAIRSRFVTWSASSIVEQISQAFSWAREKVGLHKLNIGLIDDDRLRSPRIISELMTLIKASDLRNKIKLHMQGCFSGLVDGEGNVRTDLMDEMQGVVGLINIGGDFWDTEGRLRNRGGDESKLSNAKIREIIKELAKREIAARLYWLLGDEKTTISAMTETALFLNELYLDFAPFIKLGVPEPVFPYSGTPLRQRLEASAEGKKLLKVASRLGSFPIYDFILPPGKLIAKVYRDVSLNCHMVGSEVTPSVFVNYLYLFSKQWRSRMRENQKDILDEAVDLLKQGISVTQIRQFLPEIEKLPTIFRFAEEEPRQFSIEELLEAYHAMLSIPEYYGTRELLRAEESRRNPILAKSHSGEIDHRGKKLRKRPNDPCPCASGKKYKKCCGVGKVGKKKKKKKKKQ